jgi:hypothetical protein
LHFGYHQNGKFALINESDTSTVKWICLLTKELITRRIEHFNLTPEKMEIARKKVKAARLRNKVCFDKTHRLRPIAIKKDDWVLISDNNLDMQHSTSKKFAQRFKGPSIVTKVHNNATYFVRELDGAEHQIPYAGKRVKVFKRRVESQDNAQADLEDVDESGIEEELA